MKSRRAVALVALLATAGVLASCESASDPISPDGSDARIQPLCQLGCLGEGDPDPGAPGLYLEGVEPEFCAQGSDTDEDGLNDFCEKQLSWAFRPELRYWDLDDVRREPYWAARSLSSGSVRIIYMLSYYIDLGAANGNECWETWGWLGSPSVLPACGGLVQWS